jgi:hypothetical protein
MSIFNNSTKKLHSSETELFVMFKYGEPTPGEDYFSKIPSSVIKAAHYKVAPLARSTGVEHRVLSIMLRQSKNEKAARKALIDSLVEYHMLLG